MDWYPWYPGLYRAATRHLTLSEDGAYRRLIDEYMITRQPLPDDDASLARICGISREEWASVSTAVRAFFKSRKGMLRLGRCDAELDAQDRRAQNRSEVARKGASVRWNKNNKIDATSIRGAMLSDATGQDRTGHNNTVRAASGDAAAAVMDKVFDLLGVKNDPRWLGDGGLIRAWMNGGADPEMDIFPTIQSVMARRNGQGAPKSLKYFSEAISDARSARLAGLPRPSLQVVNQAAEQAHIAATIAKITGAAK